MKASASSRTIATLGIDIGKNTFCPALAPVRPGSFFFPRVHAQERHH